MRIGQYEILIVKANGVAYEERLIGDKTYVQGEEGQEYHVKVNVYQGEDGTFPAKYLRFGLLVDGNDIGAKKRLDLSDKDNTHIYVQPATCSIMGYPAQSRAHKSFVFNLPNLVSEDTKYNTDLGSVQLLVSEAHKTGKMHPIKMSKKFTSNERNTPCILEDKKFYTQASLVTSAGQEKAHSGARVTKKNNKFGPMAAEWITVRDIPEATMMLYYHCKSTLDFLEEQESRKQRAAELVVVPFSDCSVTIAGPVVDLTTTTLNEDDTHDLEHTGALLQHKLVDISTETASDGSSVEVLNGFVMGVKRTRAITAEDTYDGSEEVLPFKVVKVETI